MTTSNPPTATTTAIVTLLINAPTWVIWVAPDFRVLSDPHITGPVSSLRTA